MSTRARRFSADVLERRPLSEHLVRLTLGGHGLDGFASTGVPDEWVGLVVPGQFQSRYYTVRSWDGDRLTLDVVLHEQGLVTEWAARDCVGETVEVSEPRGSFAMPPGASWLLLVGDITAMPAMARVAETVGPDGPVLSVLAEVTDDLRDYLPSWAQVHWLPATGESGLADAVAAHPWPQGEGYFWMAGESAQMRAIRKHLTRERGLPSSAYDVMGYWRQVTRRRPRAVDPGPIWRAGKAAGKSDEQIWADYDAAQDSEPGDGPS